MVWLLAIYAGFLGFLLHDGARYRREPVYKWAPPLGWALTWPGLWIENTWMTITGLVTLVVGLALDKRWRHYFAEDDKAW